MFTAANFIKGLSPRGRGKQALKRAAMSTSGSIPAWAGETEWWGSGGRPAEVYPRVGGGNSKMLDTIGQNAGLSPRGRGKLNHTQAQFVFERSIPAWAGETSYRTGLPTGWKVYPRVGGGNDRAQCLPSQRSGLSPRGRGKLHSTRSKRRALRSIPAWAGETHIVPYRNALIRVYPRVGGGNAPACFRFYSSPGLSPRGRGKPGLFCMAAKP